MRVLFISHDGSLNGGAGLALINLIESIKYHNIEPVILVPKGTNDLINYLEDNKIEYILSESYWWAFVDRKNIIKNVYNYMKLYLNQIKMILSLPKLINEIKSKNIEIIHSNSSVINIGALIRIFYNIPHLWHVREFGEEHMNLKFIFGTKLTRKFMSNFSDKIIVISKALEKKYLRYVKRESVITIYDGVSIDYIQKENNIIKKENKDELVILISGAIQEGKGQLFAAEVINKMIDENYKLKLLIAGRISEKQYFLDLQSFIKNSKKEDKILLLGSCNDMNRIRKDADVELVCSYMEGFGRVTVEAMLSKMPIIASDSGANPELVFDNFNGFIYKFGDAEQLKNKITLIYNNRELIELMGKKGFEFASKRFIQEINTKNICNLYNEIKIGGKNENRNC
ncbi:glycosyltransferase family 4 protein [Clostridium sp. C8]|uniref:glycosyltransferase family 4 protein n=1 Tax=Clostridium sp. C8 TaxID=1667357 RepID=UPI00062E8A97|nr:glycosyltransferase family 4 protein [Clostridium sp. C8]KLE14596.1 hypothetical protein AAT22_15810 [Clostridium sp. C8]